MQLPLLFVLVLFPLGKAEEGIVCTKSLIGKNYAPEDDSDPAVYWHCSMEVGSISYLMRCEPGHIYERRHGDCILEENDRLSKRSSSSSAKQLELLQMEAVGDEQALGSVYNARNHQFLPGRYLWNPLEGETISKNLVEQDKTQSEIQIITSDNAVDRINLLKVEASLSVTVLAGQVTVTGAAKYLNDEKRSSTTARVVLNYRSTRKSQTVPLNTPIDYIDVCSEAAESDGPTHVVTSKLLGLRAIFRFDKTAASNETKDDIAGRLAVAINSIPEFKLDAEATVDINGHETGVTEGMQVHYNGDTVIDTPTDYKTAIEAFIQVQEAAREGHATIRYQLTPLSYLCDNDVSLLQQIREGLLNSALQIMSDIGEIKQFIAALQDTPVYSSMLPIQTVLDTFERELEKYEIQFKNSLYEKVKQLRTGRAAERQLAELISKHDKSAFEINKAQDFLEMIEREISTLNLILDDVDKANEEMGTNLFTIMDAAAATDFDCEVNHNWAYTFNIKVLPRSNAASDFITSSQVPDDSDRWYNDINAVGSVGGKLQSFIEFAKATVSHRNAKKDNFCFLVSIKELEDGTEGEETHYLDIGYHYRKPNSDLAGYGTGFIPPVAPPKPVCKALYNGFEISTKGTDNTFVTEIWAEIKKGDQFYDSVKGDQDSTSLTITTLKPNTEYTVSTKYKVLDTRISEVGFGPSSEKVTCVTAPSSALTNVEVQLVYMDGVTKAIDSKLRWDRLTDVVEDEEVSIVMEVRKHGGKIDEAIYKFKYDGTESDRFGVILPQPLTLYDVYLHTTSSIGQSAPATLTICNGPDKIPAPEVLSISNETVELVERLSLLQMPRGFRPTKLEVRYEQLQGDGSYGMPITQEIAYSTHDQNIQLEGLSAGITYRVVVTLWANYGDHNQEIVPVTSEPTEVVTQDTEDYEEVMNEMTAIMNSQRSTATSVMTEAIRNRDSANSLSQRITSDDLSEARQRVSALEATIPTKLDDQKEILADVAKSMCLETGIDFSSSGNPLFYLIVTSWYECLAECQGRTEAPACNSISWNKLSGECKGRTKRRGDTPTPAQNWWSVNRACHDSMTGDKSKLSKCLVKNTSLNFSGDTMSTQGSMETTWDCWFWCVNTNNCNGAMFESDSKLCVIGSRATTVANSGYEAVLLDCMSEREIVVIDTTGGDTSGWDSGYTVW